MKTRKEILEMGVQLGKVNIAAWASKDDEERTSPAVNTIAGEQVSKSVVERRAEAWEDAEKAKYMAMYCILLSVPFDILECPNFC